MGSAINIQSTLNITSPCAFLSTGLLLQTQTHELMVMGCYFNIVQAVHIIYLCFFLVLQIGDRG